MLGPRSKWLLFPHRLKAPPTVRKSSHRMSERQCTSIWRVISRRSPFSLPNWSRHKCPWWLALDCLQTVWSIWDYWSQQRLQSVGHSMCVPALDPSASIISAPSRFLCSISPAAGVRRNSLHGEATVWHRHRSMPPRSLCSTAWACCLLCWGLFLRTRFLWSNQGENTQELKVIINLKSCMRTCMHILFKFIN